MIDLTAARSGALFAAALAGAALPAATPAVAMSYSMVYAFAYTQADADGANPYSSLVNIGGTLYGTTKNGGGAADLGTLFSIPSGFTTATDTVLYSFQGGSGDGRIPLSDLTNHGGTFYGTTQ